MVVGVRVPLLAPAAPEQVIGSVWTVVYVQTKLLKRQIRQH